MKTTILLNLVVLLVTATLAPAATRLVPDEYATIQAAIDAAVDGDVVIIAPDTYTGSGNRDIDFGGKAITVQSTDPQDSAVVAATVIDCQNSGRGFIFQNNEGLHSILSGLTIVNGYTSSSGGGIYCYGSSPTVTNCTFDRNSAEGNGGGIWCEWYSNVTVRNCTFSNNLADSGGGMYNRRSNPTLVNCTFVGNFSTYGGGGGMANRGGSDATLTNCAFIDNVANRYRGGGIRSADSDTTLTNCIFNGNSANRGGGGIGVNGQYPDTTLTNCTFNRNSSGESGGGIDVGHLSHLILTNCILWGNSDNSGMGELSQIGPEALTRSINYSCIQGWTGALGGTGNIGTDPCFVDPLRDDCHLLANSPCINTGDPSYSGTDETDIDGQPRVIGGRVDMGADEFNLEDPSIGISPPAFEFFAEEGGPNPQAQILFIYNAGIGIIDWEVSDDCSWLQVAPTSGDSTGEIDKVNLSVDVTDLARGKYNCVLTISDPAVTNSPQTVEVNLLVQGPLIELSENRFEFHADMNGANPVDQILAIRNSGMNTLNWQITESCTWLEASPTSGSSTGQINNVTLSIDIVDLAKGKYNCELTVSDSNAENSPQIVKVILYIGIEGVLLVPAEYRTIQSAIDDANDGDIVIVAGGIYRGTGNRDINFKGKAITVRSENGAANCIIDCQGSESEPHRGFYFHSGEGPNSVLRGFTVTGGFVTDSYLGGAGVLCSDASPKITNCIFRGNSAVLGGGGLCYIYSSSPEIINCTFYNNSVQYGGGGAVAGRSFHWVGEATMRNCIVWGNIGDEYQPGISIQPTPLCERCGPNPINVSFTLLQEQSSYSSINRYEVIVADPCFTDADDNDYHLLPDSPCIDAGDPNYIAEPNETDLDGKPRIIGGRIDMGAYEYSPPIPAEVRIVPRTLNLSSEGKWITSLFWLPEDYDVADIDANSVLLEGEIQAESILVYEQQQIVIVRFSRSEVQGILAPGEVELTVSGELADGTVFEGTDVIRVIDKGKKKNQPPNVTITKPQDGAVFGASETIEIEANAWDVDGSVVKVEFFADESKIGEDNDGTDGWKSSWNNHPAGSYSLTAKATDNDGAAATSPAVGIMVVETPLPGQASNPNPADGATSVSLYADLSWTAGSNAASHDVYFGMTSPGAFRGNQTATTFDPGTMAYTTMYYWRIDEVNAGGTTTGTVWSFTTGMR